MPELIIWKDREIDKLKRDMERLMFRLRKDFGMPFFKGIAGQVPSIDLSETESELIIKAKIAGLNPEDLDIVISGDMLTIKGELKQEFVKESENYHRTERRHGSFARTIQIPCRIRTEDVEASYKDEILTIVMPKCKPEKAPAVKIKVE
ncbi:MAG TPA: Hsp20/alpha crystallin family protein [Desulfobacterales bacterium]|nr:Hsp20/alpha crystallin family protein [Desulfobacterales bacterium]